MKKFITRTTALLFGLSLITACGSQKTTTETKSEKEEIVAIAPQEPINQTVPYRESVMLLGKADREGFAQEPFSSWFDSNYAGYSTDEKTLVKLKPLVNDIQIKVFMGTWCGDSKRETPRFYKVLDALEFDQSNMDLVTVDRTKTTPDGLEKGLHIIRVPTFIFYKDGKEINRIVEYPVETLEKDMLSILSGEPYKHSYAQ